MNPVSLEVAAAIARSGLTQSQVAEAMGTTQSAVARLCNPDYWGHSVESLRKVALALNIPLEVKFGSTGVQAA